MKTIGLSTNKNDVRYILDMSFLKIHLLESKLQAFKIVKETWNWIQIVSVKYIINCKIKIKLILKMRIFYIIVICSDNIDTVHL